MTTATVTVEYVNQPKPGKKMGSIKTKELGYLNVWPEGLGQFEKGKSYTVEFEESGDFKTFKKLVAQPANGNGTHAEGYQRAKPPMEQRAMFVMGVVGRAMGSGQFTATDIKILTLAAAEAWDELANKDQAP